jgi:hypothetical protein
LDIVALSRFLKQADAVIFGHSDWNLLFQLSPDFTKAAPPPGNTY